MLVETHAKEMDAAYHDDVAVKVLADIDITLHDGVEGGDVDTTRFETKDGWLEESLWCTETLVANGDDLSIRKLVRLLERRALAGSLDLLLEVEGDVAELLLDVTNDFTLGGGREDVSTLGKNLHEVVGQITTSHVDTGDGVWESETLVDWHNVSDSVTRVEDDTGGTSRGVQGEHSLDGDVEGWCVEGLEDNLCHLLSVALWVDWGLGEQDWVLLWCYTELVVEGVVPDLLHVVPVGDNTVLNWVPQCEDTTLALCLISNVRVLLTHTNHDTMLLSDINGKIEDGGSHTHGGAVVQQWMLLQCQLFILRCFVLIVEVLTEDSSWRIVTGETGLTHTRATSLSVSALHLYASYPPPRLARIVVMTSEAKLKRGRRR